MKSGNYWSFQIETSRFGGVMGPSCDYVTEESREAWQRFVENKIGELMGIKKDDVHAMMRYLKKHKTMFMRWEGIDITKELNAKVSQEVYA